jgi:hypothetical protein
MAGAQRLPALLALAVGALAGDVFVLLVNRLPLPAEAHLDPWGDTLPYSYRDPNCTIPADPITVVFYYNATIPNMHTHAHHHGGWSYHDGDTQYFFDHYCGLHDGQDASNPGWDPLGRYHMRYWWWTDPYWGTYTLATPHHEDLVWCGHAVDSNWDEWPGGFVRARQDIAKNWHRYNNGGSHYFAGSQYWGNTAAMWQCDGQPAWSDGNVDFVRVP